jgi:serine protease Do
MKRLLTFVAIILLLFGLGIQAGVLDIGKINSRLPRLQIPSKEKTPKIKESVKLVEEESDIVNIVDKLSPSVVTVKIKQTRKFFEVNPFDPFSFFNRPQQKEQKIERNIGSGFFVSSDGWVVTNKHVVSERDAKYEVLTIKGKTLQVSKIYRDPSNDIAILKVKGGNEYQALELGDSDKLKVGQTVIAIGTPLGEFQGTVTKGIISGLGRGIDTGSPFAGYVERLDNIIQTDAAINPGNSGGPLVNIAGQVIGVNTAVASGAENIGFAIPINVVRDALKSFKDTGSFQRAFLGVSYKIITRELSVMNDIPEGAFILEVTEGSAAQRAGIKKGDIIIKFDGKRVNKKNDLAKLIKKKKAGDNVLIVIWRDGDEKSLQVKLKSLE